MLLLNQIVDCMLRADLYALIFLVLADIVLIYIVQAHKPVLKNKYFQFHRQYGFLKITILKLICALFISYLLLEPSPNAGTLVAPIVFYGFLVTKLLIDFVRKEG